MSSKTITCKTVKGPELMLQSAVLSHGVLDMFKEQKNKRVKTVTGLN